MRMKNTDNNSRRLTVDTKELQLMLCCGRDTAVKIGLEAEARINIGKRALWNVNKIQKYLDDLSCGELNEQVVEQNKKWRNEKNKKRSIQEKK